MIYIKRAESNLPPRPLPGERLGVPPQIRDTQPVTSTRTDPVALAVAFATGLVLVAGAGTIAYGAGYRINKATDEQLHAIDELKAAFGTPTPSTSATVTPAQWGQPAAIDGYTITISKPTYSPCDDCGNKSVFVAPATITAGTEPIDPDTIHLRGIDTNGSDVSATTVLDNPLPAGATRKVTDLEVHVDAAYRSQRWTLRQTSRDGKTAVEWVYG